MQFKFVVVAITFATASLSAALPILVSKTLLQRAPHPQLAGLPVSIVSAPSGVDSESVFAQLRQILNGGWRRDVTSNTVLESGVISFETFRSSIRGFLDQLSRMSALQRREPQDGSPVESFVLRWVDHDKMNDQFFAFLETL
ncbi:hypothetical protein HGRIS_004857 [Hohenbuehelia grisea]|uniref:Uncharacterized protein n=1 Tax=Hohenbuehelia grisea TaxID=104357 RepID=A0ABR3JDT9_9AGAR